MGKKRRRRPMLLPKRQGKEWISGRNCWLHGLFPHRPLVSWPRTVRVTEELRDAQRPRVIKKVTSLLRAQQQSVWHWHGVFFFKLLQYFGLKYSYTLYTVPAFESLFQASTILTRSTSARVCAFGYWHSNWGNKWKRILRISAAEERSKEKNNICWKHIARQRTCCVVKVCESHSFF